MLGWFREEIDLASRSKRCFASGLDERCEGRILTATVRSRRVSRARYTSPIPPAPSGETILYGPRFVPEVRAIRARHYSAAEAYSVDPTIVDGWSANLSLPAYGRVARHSGFLSTVSSFGQGRPWKNLRRSAEPAATTMG